MTRRIVAVLLAVTVVVLATLEVPLAISYERRRVTATTTELERDALAIGDAVEDDLELGTTARLADVVDDYEEVRGARALVVDATGTALADSDPPLDLSPSVGRSFAARPEIIEALAGQTAVITRDSDSLGQTLFVVAVPIRSGGDVLGAVRVSRPRGELDEDVWRYRGVLLTIALVTLGVAAGLGWWVGRWATRAVNALQGATDQLERGQLDVRADTTAGPPEIRELAERFNSMAGRLGTLVQSSQEFAADASHQLRSPLTAIRLRLENLAATDPDDTALEPILGEVDRLDRTIDALLALTRLDRTPAAPATVPVESLLEERAEMWRPMADERDVRVVVRPGPSLTVLFDPNHLEQVLDNLIANAIEVTRPGQSIELAATAGDDHVELHVIDTGPGLDAEHRQRAFDRAWGLRPDGTGLGLALVARLCAHNQATARLDPADAGGTDAVVSAPRPGSRATDTDQ